jgi:hypothetical protein
MVVRDGGLEASGVEFVPARRQQIMERQDKCWLAHFERNSGLLLRRLFVLVWIEFLGCCSAAAVSFAERRSSL